MKEFDELRGSTSLFEAGFFDLEYGYNILELVVFNSPMLTGVNDKEKMRAIMNNEDT